MPDVQETDVNDHVTVSLKGNSVIIYSCIKGVIVVWDFITDTVASWSVREHGSRDKVRYLFSSTTGESG